MNIVEKIDQFWSKPSDEAPRSYLGASSIGNECYAYHALSLRGFESDEPMIHIKRIFRDGHRLEDQTVEDLKSAGYNVLEVDPDTGKQWEYKEFGGHIAMHSDGMIGKPGEGAEVLLEIKSMNQVSFNKYVKHGLLKANPNYYAQVQFIMHYGKIKQAVLVAYSKNQSKYHSEMVDYDPIYASMLAHRAEIALAGEKTRQKDHQELWPCKMCFKKDSCWNGKTPKVLLCRHCEHSEPASDGGWLCNQDGMPATKLCSDFKLFKVTPRG